MGCIWYTNQQGLVGGCTSHANPEQAWTSKTRAKPPARKNKENEHSSVSLGVSTPILKLVSRVVCVSLRSFIASDYPWSLSISQVQNQSHKVYQGAMLSCGPENDGFIYIYGFAPIENWEDSVSPSNLRYAIFRQTHLAANFHGQRCMGVSRMSDMWTLCSLPWTAGLGRRRRLLVHMLTWYLGVSWCPPKK